MDPFATLQQLLIRHIMATKGPIAETGCGHYSTPLLYEIACAQGRVFHSYIQNQAWAANFRHLEGPNYRQIWVDFTRPFDLQENYEILFLDHEQLVRDRLKHLPRLLKQVERVVVHDADISPGLVVGDRIDCDEQTPKTIVTRFKSG